jgi:nitrite reductase/ring-hydroxylating ferredoxin subunit
MPRVIRIVDAPPDGLRRVSCGPLALLSEGMMVGVPIIPAFIIEDDALGTVKVRGAVVARKGGRVFAYANICRHIPLSLDLGDGDVASADRQVFLCHHHGARYRIEDGKCLYGPCDGDSLFPLPFEERDGELILLIPDTA